jgi:ornithine cyclodeaminase/alanine dehydrogenase-like protein (mu-crystallin family)
LIRRWLIIRGEEAPIPVLIIDQRQVERLLPMPECIDAMHSALSAVARGEAVLPLRLIVWLPDRSGALGLMPAHLKTAATGAGDLGVKVVTFFPKNEGTDRDSHQGAVLVFESEHGSLEAIVDATSITAIRTAAVSGVATRLLARENARELALVGSGVQARTHLAAMLAVRPIRRVRVASQDVGRARRFAEREAKRHGIPVEPAASVREAVQGADVVCTATSSRVPVVSGEWLSAGAHVNAVGSSVSSARELDTAAVVRSRLYVDRRESALAEAGDFLLARKEGAVGDDHIVGEIGEVAIGRVPGRGSREEITLFKSVGLAVEDVAAARLVAERARALGPGDVLEIDLGGARYEAE